ncbi:MAG: complex I NDUFA9 subunit family protein [Gemmatimonadota bacterium]|nr:complex I NDUFA9 subunit family protein [Gemmatimonadota bacterium]
MAAVAVAEQPDVVSVLRSKPVLITGAAGLVGRHTCDELTKHGWKVRALVRNPSKAAMRLAHLPVELHVGDIRNPESIGKAIAGCGSVVHLAAVAIERSGQGYSDVNTDGTANLIEQARAAGIDRFIHMSQNGADSASPHEFLRSKGLAQDAVVASGLSHTVLRPSVIFGPEDEFVNVLARLVRLSPIVFPLPDGGRARFQPIAVRDVAAVVRITLEKQATRRGTYSLGGPAPLSLKEMTERILAAMGVTRRLVTVPVSALRPLIALAEKMIPNPPVTSSLLGLLSLDNTVPNNAITEVFGLTPTPFAPDELQYLRRISASSALSSLFQRH